MSPTYSSYHSDRVEERPREGPLSLVLVGAAVALARHRRHHARRELVDHRARLRRPVGLVQCVQALRYPPQPSHCGSKVILTPGKTRI